MIHNLFKFVLKLINQRNRWIAEERKINIKILSFIQSKKDVPLPEREKQFNKEIIIPCYNHGKYLKFILNILEGVEIPITIIDDCSTDDSKRIILDLNKQYPFKFIENKHNLLQYGSLNKAVSQSENNFFIVINADDMLIPQWIEYAIQSFENSHIFLFGGSCIHFHIPYESNDKLCEIIKNTSYLPKNKMRIYNQEDAKRFNSFNSINMNMNGFCFLRSAWEYVGGFFPKEKRVCIHDDRDFQMRVCAFFDVGVSDEISAFVREDSSMERGTL